MMRTLGSILLALGAATSTATAQIDELVSLDGPFSVGISVAGTVGVLQCSDDGDIVWRSDNPAHPDPYASVALPFDVFLGMRSVGAGEIVVLGSDSAFAQHSLSLMTFGLDGQGNPGIQVFQTLALANGASSTDIVFNASENAIYLYDRSSSELLRIPRMPGQALTQPIVVADFSTYSPAPGDLVAPGAGDPTTGAILVESHAGPAGAGKWHVAQSGGSWQITDLTVSPPPGLPATPGLAVKDQRLVSIDGPIEVLIPPGGTVLLIRVSDGVGVAGATLPPTPSWQQLPLPSGALDASTLYQLVATGFTPSSSFFAGFRYGFPDQGMNIEFDNGYLKYNALCVGNSDFRVFSKYKWTTPAVPAAPVYTFLAATVGEPGPATLTTLPSGQVMLNTPEFVIPTTDPTPFQRQDNRELNQADLPIPNDTNLTGAAVLFQWGAVQPNGALVISDVFGGRIMANETASLTTPSDTPQARRACRQWLNGCHCPQSKQRIHQAWGQRVRGQ